jgi:hypothetical protein
VLTDLLGGISIGSIGQSGLNVITILLILSGKLVPKSTLDNARADGQTWRGAHDKQQEINRVQSDALAELLTLARADHHALTEIQALGTRVAAHQEGQAGDT